MTQAVKLLQAFKHAAWYGLGITASVMVSNKMSRLENAEWTLTVSAKNEKRNGGNRS